MASQTFVDSVMKEVIQPGVEQLMQLPYFTELRTGKLSTKRAKKIFAHQFSDSSACRPVHIRTQP